jgi:hypothetical protein
MKYIIAICDLLFTNQRPEDLNIQTSYLLVKTPVHAHEAGDACKSLGEQLVASYNPTEMHNILANRQIDHGIQDIDHLWGITNSTNCQGFSFKNGSLEDLDCSTRYPALCTNTAPLQTTSFHPPTDKKHIVNTKLGKIQGFRDRVSFRFEGIPYAKPPIGDLRFKAPQPVENLTSDGSVHDATYFRAMCPVSQSIFQFNKVGTKSLAYADVCSKILPITLALK